ncbi:MULTISPECIES: DUF4238 domain-containing protein [Pectobacterium]|uniref:DUF4238 domain-containing protein n=1 Tax=Pectobacterium TaxID=122277 RepID=UPI001314F5DC|nr:DUF4238 domain-containing protein [Pectobacterium carotovorum]GKV75867.1 hypothetical protein PEC106568_10410 [Pectobacterium carotovorum subsp. carotovorum]
MEEKKFKATIRQHYVYRKYLSSWTPEKKTTGMIQCYRKEEKKIFPSSLMGVGQSRYFYEFHILTEIEKMMVCLMTQTKNKTVKETNPLHTLKEITDIEKIQKIHEFYKNGGASNTGVLSSLFSEYDADIYTELRREVGEKMQGLYESSGLPFLKPLTEGDIEFLKNKKNVMDFVTYLAMQYIRTAYMRDRQNKLFLPMIKEHEQFLRFIPFCNEELKAANIPFNSEKAQEEMKDIDKNLNFEKVHPYTLMSHVTELTYGIAILHKPVFHILESVENVNFITSDQPVINIHFDPFSKDEPSDVVFYYPLSPKYAVIIDFNNNNYERKCSAEQVIMYNQKIINLSFSQIYSIHAEDFRINGIVG